MRSRFVLGAMVCLLAAGTVVPAEPAGSLRMAWKDNYLTITGPNLPGGEMRVLYLEAYCRPGSTDRDWKETVIGHTTELVSASGDGREIKLRCRLNDGVVVDHVLTATADEVDFRLTAHNPTKQESQAHWAQPCVRVDKFTGLDKTQYVSKCFLFLDGKLERMPTKNWAMKARYVPGQVWAAKGVDRNDVNPRPLSDATPSNGLIGCFSGDDKWLMASAWEPYQELFQGVAHCVHSDFRLGGLKPGETKRIKGKLYILPNDVEALLARYKKDFPEQQ